MPLAEGTRLGRYEIRSLLGTGGMGEVYLAHDSQLRRPIALKLLPAQFAENESRLRRFRQEAYAAAALSHPNIAHIYEIGCEGQINFIAMEFVDGETLRSKIYEGKNDLNKLLQYLVQVAEGLAKAHSAGIVHRDLKPDNIMITRDGFAKILDFGLAKLSAPELFSSSKNDDSSRVSTLFLQQTVPGTILGTVGYMSPEQACGDSTKIDLRTDIFAFGCILFEAATKRVAFQGASDIDTIHKIIYAETPVISDYNSTAAADLQRILRRCLAKDPDARYQTAKDVAIELSELTSASHDKVRPALGEVRSSLEQLSQTAATKVFKVNNTSRAPLLLTVGVLLLVVLATAAYFVVTRKRTLIPPQQRLISTFPGSHRSATFSPDAKSIAFVSDVDNVSQVWTRNLAEEAAKQITFGESGSARPRWSPNGDQIIYGRTVAGASGIWSVKPEGGEPRKLIEGGRNGNWSWDGKRIVFERGYDIWTTNSDGSDQRRIEGVPPTDLLLADRTPAFSPDGKQIVFFQKDKGPIGDLWVIPSAGGQARRITFDNTHGGHPVFTHDGKYIVFSSQRAGSLTLWKVPVNGGEPEAVLVSAGEDTEPAISRDGSQLIYTNTRNQFQLVSTDPGSGETKTLHESRVDLFDPSFSPSGDKVLFFQMASSGDIQLFTINADGTGLGQVTHGKDQRNIHPQWSADGTSVYFYQFAPTVSFRKLQLGNEPSTELVAGWEWGTHIGARVDPQGRRVIYSKLDKGQVVATMIRDLTNGTESAFTIPLRFPRWSPDGQNIVGMDAIAEWNLADLIICPVNGGECRRLVRGRHPHWNTPSHLYFIRTSKQRDVQEIWTLPITDGKETKVIDFGPLHPIGVFFDVSSSGKIVWVKYQRGRNELWLASLSAS